MPSHTAENVSELASRLRLAVDLAQPEYEQYRAGLPQEPAIPRAAVA